MVEDNQSAPECGLYIVLKDTSDHNKQAFLLGQALHAANRFSTYSMNRHVVIFVPSDTNPATTEDVQLYQKTCANNGFIFLIEDDAELVRRVGADGVLCRSVQSATSARKLLGEDAIIGLKCADKSAVQSALAHELDFITAVSSKEGDRLLDMVNWWGTATDNPVAVAGVFDPENCAPFVKAGVTFIDSSFHIWDHPSGNVIQGVVNMLDAFERHKMSGMQLN